MIKKIIILLIISIIFYLLFNNIKKNNQIKPKIEVVSVNKVLEPRATGNGNIENYVSSSVNAISINFTIKTGAGFEENNINEIDFSWGNSKYKITGVRNFTVYENIILRADDVTADETDIEDLKKPINIKWGDTSSTPMSITLPQDSITEEDLNVLVDESKVSEIKIEPTIVNEQIRNEKKKLLKSLYILTSRNNYHSIIDEWRAYGFKPDGATSYNYSLVYFKESSDSNYPIIIKNATERMFRDAFDNGGDIYREIESKTSIESIDYGNTPINFTKMGDYFFIKKKNPDNSETYARLEGDSIIYESYDNITEDKTKYLNSTFYLIQVPESDTPQNEIISILDSGKK